MSPFLLFAFALAVVLLVVVVISARRQRGPQGHGAVSAEAALREADSRLRDHGNFPAFLPRDKR